MNEWKEKIFSQECKVVVIKNVVQAIPSYAMSCFLLPISVIRSLKFYGLAIFLLMGMKGIKKKSVGNLGMIFVKLNVLGVWAFVILKV